MDITFQVVWHLGGHFCDFLLWLPFKVADSTSKLKTDPNLVVLIFCKPLSVTVEQWLPFSKFLVIPTIKTS